MKTPQDLATERHLAAMSRRNFLRGLGACIAQASYEVGPEFVAAFAAGDRDSAPFFVPSRNEGRALFDLHGRTLCQAEHIPMHLGSFLELIPHIIKRYPLNGIQPGDVFVGNDAYEGGGTHLPDIVLAEPVFVENEMIAWCVNLAHHADFADRGHAHIYQEGLRIPPIRLYKAGVLQDDVMALILLNCQVPRERLSDFRAQMAANRLGVQRLQGLCAKYGRDTVLDEPTWRKLRREWGHIRPAEPDALPVESPPPINNAREM